MLIVSPPSEYFVKCVLRANQSGETHLACFSPGAARFARGKWRNHPALKTCLATPEHLPFDTGSLDVVLAYCYLDFVPPETSRAAAGELRRVLRGGGRALGTYLAPPRTTFERVSVFVTTRVPWLMPGVRVVQVANHLKGAGFSSVKIYRCPQLGMPVELFHAIA